MPIPKPHANEEEKEFISRCMGDEAMQEYDQDQRAAICYRTWKEKDKVEAVELSEIKDGLVRIAVAYTGQKYKQGEKEFSITMSDLEDMQRNIMLREVPIDYEHLSAQQVPPGWSKAAGWIKPQHPQIQKLSDGRSVLWAWFEPTSACAAGIRAKEFRYFSPEIHWNAQDEKGKSVGTRLAAGAITNRPFLKDLPPIEIAATDYPQLLEAVALAESKRLLIDTGDVHVPGLNRKKENTMKTLKFRKLTEGEHKGKHGVFDGDEMVGLAEYESMKSCMSDNDADDEKKKVAATETACFTELAKAKPGDVARLTDQFVDEGKFDTKALRRAERIEKLLTEAVKTGKILPARRQHWYELALANYDNTAAILSDMKPVVDLSVHGTDGEGKTMTAKEQVREGVNALMKESPKMPYDEALKTFARKNPEVWKEYETENSAASGARR